VPGPPVGLIAVHVPSDLRGPGTERASERRELDDLTGLRINTKPVGGQRCPKVGVAHHRRVTDAIDRIQAVAHPDSVQTPPLALSENPGVDLEVKVPMWITSTGGVVPHHSRLNLLHWDLDLAPTWTDPCGRVLGQPPDDLHRCPVLRAVVRRGDVWVQCGRQ